MAGRFATGMRTKKVRRWADWAAHQGCTGGRDLASATITTIFENVLEVAGDSRGDARTGVRT